MHLSYQTLSHPNEEAYEDHGIKCTILKPDNFKQYKQALEDDNRYVHIVAKTRFQEIDESKNTTKSEDSKDYLEVPDKNGEMKKFKIYQKRHRLKTIGYLPISDTEFVQIESGIPLLLLLLPLLAALSLGLYFGTRPNQPIDPPGIEDDNTHDWDGNEHNNGSNSKAASENTVIPGFASVTANQTANNVQLYNPKENTVKFVYTITEQISEKKIATKKTIEEAQSYVSANEHNYTNDYENETSYRLIDKTNNQPTDTYVDYQIKETKKNQFDIMESKSKVIYFTKGIKPGKAVDWNIYQSLQPGEHELKFRISTYDVKTDQQCYGAILDVKATIQ